MDHHSVFTLRVEVLGLYYLGVQLGAVVGLDSQELRGDLGQVEGGTGAFAQDLHLASLCRQDGGDGRGLHVGEPVHQVLSVAGEGGEVESGLLRDLLQLAVFDVQAVDLALNGRVLGGGEVCPGACGVDVDRLSRHQDLVGRVVDEPIPLGELLDEFALLRIQVEVHEAVALGQPEEAFPAAEEDGGGVEVLVYPVRVRLLEEGTALAAGGIPGIQS